MKTGVSSPTLRKVLDGDLCSGCGLCAGISGGAIAIEESAKGFNRPVQHRPVAKEIEAKINHCCPGSAVAGWHDSERCHPYWGPALSVDTGYSTDPELRFKASSGGILSALLGHALGAGLVDEVVQIAANPSAPTRNVLKRNMDQRMIEESAGSRYAPSSPLENVAELLDEDRRFAFIGKPCDVSALRRLAEMDRRVNESFPIMLSFFCGGIPSTAGTDQILEDLQVEKSDLARFTYRGDGWPGNATALRKDGTSASMSYAESWGGRLSSRVQFRCKICPDAVGGAADIACADAWFGDEAGYPSFEETDGRSLVIARSETGRALLSQAVSAGRISLQSAPLSDVDRMQPFQAKRKRLIASRVAALVATFQPRPQYRGVCVASAARRAGVPEAAKSFLGMVRRILTGRKG